MGDTNICFWLCHALSVCSLSWNALRLQRWKACSRDHLAQGRPAFHNASCSCARSCKEVWLSKLSLARDLFASHSAGCLVCLPFSGAWPGGVEAVNCWLWHGDRGKGIIFQPAALYARSSQERGLEVLKLSPEHKMLLLQVALKSADLGHVAEDLDVHLMCVVVHVLYL